MAMITIELFGKFRVMVNEKDVTLMLGNSKKGYRMLVYLILQRGGIMTSLELYELLWPNEAVTNPESALKTLMSRTRSTLSRIDPLLAKCIVTIPGAYRWNAELPITIDVFTFEILCKELLHTESYNHSTEETLKQVFSLYKGDLFTMSDSESWIVSRNEHYSSLFTKTVHHVLRLLEDKHLEAEIVSIARRVLEVDPLDEKMHVALMRALIRLNCYNKARDHYHRTKEVHLDEYGLRLPESIQNLYKYINQSGQLLDSDVDAIRLSFQQEILRKNKAYSCEYAIFQNICLPLIHILAHLGECCYLAMLMIAPVSEPDRINCPHIKGAMSSLLSAIDKELRPCDIMTRCSPTQVLIFLPSTEMKSCYVLLEKIHQAFAKLSRYPTLKLTSKLFPLTNQETFEKNSS